MSIYMEHWFQNNLPRKDFLWFYANVFYRFNELMEWDLVPHFQRNKMVQNVLLVL